MSEQHATKSKTTALLIAGAVAVLAALGVGTFALKGDSGKNAQVAEISAKIEPAQQDSSENAPTPDAQAQGTEASAVDPQNPVVAIVDGKQIKRGEVARFLENQGVNLQQQKIDDIFPLALEQVIRGQIVINKASEAKLDNDPEVLSQLEGAKKHIMNTVFLQRTVDTKITDDVMKAAYDDYVKQIPEAEERRARHILVENEDKAKEVIAKLKEKSFEDLAKEYSKDSSGQNGGDLGYFTKERMVPEFANAAFSLKKGDVTAAPVQSQFGWHVIKVEDIRQKPKPTLEELRPALQVQLRQEILNELIDNWQSGAKVERFDLNGNPVQEEAGENKKDSN